MDPFDRDLDQLRKQMQSELRDKLKARRKMINDAHKKGDIQAQQKQIRKCQLVLTQSRVEQTNGEFHKPSEK